MTFAEYRKLDRVNASTLKEMLKSPLHYHHRVTHPRDDTTRLSLGRAVHTAVLEPDRFPLDYAVFLGERRAGKEWALFCEAHPEQTILKAAEYDMCIAIRDSIRSHPLAKQYLADGTPEHTVLWTDEETGIECKARLDWVSKSVPGFCDLKTTGDIEERLFGATAARMAYHLQLAFYAEGLRAHGLDLPATILAVEMEPPHDRVVYELDEDALWLGSEKVRECLRKVAECRASGNWPGRYEGAQLLSMPSWAFGPDEEEDAAMGLVVGQGA